MLHRRSLSFLNPIYTRMPFCSGTKENSSKYNKYPYGYNIHEYLVGHLDPYVLRTGKR